MHTYMVACTHTHMYIHIHAYMCTHTTHVHMQTCIHLCTHTRAHAHTYMYTHIHVRTQMRTYTHTAHTHTQSRSLFVHYFINTVSKVTQLRIVVGRKNWRCYAVIQEDASSSEYPHWCVAQHHSYPLINRFHDKPNGSDEENATQL